MLSATKKKGRTNDMGKHSTEQAAGARRIETLGGGYALKWDDETQMSVNAHAALLSQFAKAGGFLDRLVETCPMRLTSNNAPEVRDLIATVMVSMVNGATRFRHFDRLRGDTATAELRMALAVVVHPGDETSGAHSRPMLAEYLKFVSSVRKPRLVRGDVSFGSESAIGDCEAADVRCLFKARRTKGVRGEFLSLLAEPGAWRGSSDGWQCAERDVRLDSWARARRMVFARRPAEAMPKRRKSPPTRKFTQLGIPGLELVEASDETCADGYEWYALVTDLDMDANEKAQGIYRAISAFLAKVASASQLGVEQRRQLIVAYALRRYGLVRRLFPPLIGRQATLPLR